MENFGILALLSPVLTVVLAIWTKDVIVSLFLGIFAGAMTVAGGNPLQALLRLTDLLAEMLADGWNIRIILFCALLGALVGMWHKTGAAYAFGSWAGKKAKSKTSVLLFTWIFGIIIFIDDYFNSLTIGACMRPVTNEKKISRAKLAYILDSTAAPVCIIALISSRVITVMSYTKGSEGFDKLGISEFTYFIRTIPNNLYALFAILMVAFVAFKGRDFGPMVRSEARAEKGFGLFDENKYGTVAGKLDQKAATTNATWFDFLFRLCCSLSARLCSSRSRHGWARLMAKTFTTWVKRWPRCPSERLSTIPMRRKRSFIQSCSRLSFPISILCCGVSSIFRRVPKRLWKESRAIMIPIAMPIAVALGEKMGLSGNALINITVYSTASVMGGAVFGDHCSPISDTTILSSTGANCPHLEHVATQMPYAVFVAICAAFGIAALGITDSTILALLVTAVMFAIGIWVLPKVWGVQKYKLED